MVENGFTLPPGQPTNGFGGTVAGSSDKLGDPGPKCLGYF